MPRPYHHVVQNQNLLAQLLVHSNLLSLVALAKKLRVPRTLWGYEHVIRNHEDWDRIHKYIEANPVMWAKDEENPLFLGKEKPGHVDVEEEK